MSAKVITIGPETSADVAWTYMWRHRIRHLVVMDGTRVVGMLSARASRCVN
jgi:CBS domain-containing protein